MTTAADIARELRYALDPVAWATDRLGFAPDPWQTRVMRSSARQILLNCSRQSGKSTVTAILAAHAAIYRPGALILLLSKAQRQSAELLLKVQQSIRAVRPRVKLESDSVLSCKLSNGSRILSLPGDGDTVRGFSAPSLVIEDEAAFVSDSLYFAVRPMLAVSGGRLILLSTPHGKRGHFYEAWANGGDAWGRESVTAHDVPRITPEFLQQERDTIGDYWLKQEYLCQFVDVSDQLFSSESIHSAISSDLAPLEISL